VILKGGERKEEDENIWRKTERVDGRSGERGRGGGGGREGGRRRARQMHRQHRHRDTQRRGVEREGGGEREGEAQKETDRRGGRGISTAKLEKVREGRSTKRVLKKKTEVNVTLEKKLK
jgi:hypothetical protein